MNTPTYPNLHSLLSFGKGAHRLPYNITLKPASCYMNYHDLFRLRTSLRFGARLGVRFGARFGVRLSVFLRFFGTARPRSHSTYAGSSSIALAHSISYRSTC